MHGRIGDWQKSKVDVFSLEGLIAWLEMQSPSTRYRYGDIDGCPLALYFRSQGYRWAFCGATRFSYSRFFLPPIFSKAIPEELNDVVLCGEHTYGAALARARAMQDPK